jgi:large subunit ribosomal protein L16
MLVPKLKTYYKSHYLSSLGKTNSFLAFGDSGLKALTGGHLSSNQIEAARRVITRMLKKEGVSSTIWLRIFPSMSKTKKLSGRMGMGKGGITSWYANVKAEQIVFELPKLDDTVARRLTSIVSSKLPIKLQLVTKK